MSEVSPDEYDLMSGERIIPSLPIVLFKSMRGLITRPSEEDLRERLFEDGRVKKSVLNINHGATVLVNIEPAVKRAGGKLHSCLNDIVDSAAGTAIQYILRDAFENAEKAYAVFEVDGDRSTPIIGYAPHKIGVGLYVVNHNDQLKYVVEICNWDKQIGQVQLEKIRADFKAIDEALARDETGIITQRMDRTSPKVLGGIGLPSIYQGARKLGGVLGVKNMVHKGKKAVVVQIVIPYDRVHDVSQKHVSEEIVSLDLEVQNQSIDGQVYDPVPVESTETEFILTDAKSKESLNDLISHLACSITSAPSLSERLISYMRSPNREKGAKLPFCSQINVPSNKAYLCMELNGDHAVNPIAIQPFLSKIRDAIELCAAPLRAANNGHVEYRDGSVFLKTRNESAAYVVDVSNDKGLKLSSVYIPLDKVM